MAKKKFKRIEGGKSTIAKPPEKQKLDIDILIEVRNDEVGSPKYCLYTGDGPVTVELLENILTIAIRTAKRIPYPDKYAFEFEPENEEDEDDSVSDD